MRIIITKMSAGARPREVKDFLASGARARFALPFGDPPLVEKCRVVKIVDEDTGDVEYVALASITPEKAALRAIKRLNQTSFRGRIVEVRKYHYRSKRNDRRVRAYPVGEDKERREDERRRPNLSFETEKGPAKVEGMRDFTRTYGH
jgi:hypothetical protein